MVVKGMGKLYIRESGGCETGDLWILRISPMTTRRVEGVFKTGDVSMTFDASATDESQMNLTG